ncbi:DUF5919 domain-containing protein [Nocardioides sp.]|uniref:DUF5919 domain-containing protein n=1 Tax=Nocardioides sp. TaxID=35761 RepID=UPI0019851CE3|nr:DUF5919 domain-containing protein [Nocardioides sp.]MBC7276216.1 hypothetical protein [Nocardioides sp.]
MPTKTARPTQDAQPTTVLKALLERTHSAQYAVFVRDYNRHARTASPEMKAPSRATFYRWLNGDLGTRPHPGHRRVLASMFPGWEVAELTQTWEPGMPLVRERSDRPTPATVGDLAGVTHVFQNRPAFLREFSTSRLFDAATEVDGLGLSHNLLCQQYSDGDLADLLGRARVRLLFLDPDGEAIRVRNTEEGHAEGHLSEWTRVNLQVIAKHRASLSPDAADRVQVRLYDETIRFQVMLIDGNLGIVQPYLPRGRGLDSPTFAMQHLIGAPSLYSTYRQIFDDIWARGSEVAA